MQGFFTPYLKIVSTNCIPQWSSGLLWPLWFKLKILCSFNCGSNPDWCPIIGLTTNHRNTIPPVTVDAGRKENQTLKEKGRRVNHLSNISMFEAKIQCWPKLESQENQAYFYKQGPQTNFCKVPGTHSARTTKGEILQWKMLLCLWNPTKLPEYTISALLFSCFASHGNLQTTYIYLHWVVLVLCK